MFCYFAATHTDLLIITAGKRAQTALHSEKVKPSNNKDDGEGKKRAENT